MKVIFRNFFYFFTDRQKACDRKGEQPPQKSQKVGEKIAQLEGPAAEKQKVGHGSAQDGGHQKKAHPPVPHGHGVDEEGRRHQQPEHQVQEAAHNPPGDAHPQNAKQVVQQAHRHPQRQGARQRDGLGRD